jgi:hypothetical protein
MSENADFDGVRAANWSHAHSPVHDMPLWAGEEVKLAAKSLLHGSSRLRLQTGNKPSKHTRAAGLWQIVAAQRHLPLQVREGRKRLRETGDDFRQLPDDRAEGRPSDALRTAARTAGGPEGAAS